MHGPKWPPSGACPLKGQLGDELEWRELWLWTPEMLKTQSGAAYIQRLDEKAESWLDMGEEQP